MSSTGVSRGYGAEDEEPVDSQHAEIDEGGHTDAHAHGEPDPTWVNPSDSTLDDIYITTGGRRGIAEPVGFLPPDRILDTMIPPPLAYKVDFGRAIVGGIVGTVAITPLFYALYFGYKDNCFDVGMLLGSIFQSNGAPEGLSRLLGIGVHLGVGIAFAITYAYTLLVFRTQGNAGRGVQFAIGLWFAMMNWIYPLFVGFLARWLPDHRSFDNPDFLLNQTGPSNVGWAPLVVALFMHILWGLFVGHIYRHKIVIVQSERPELAPIAA